ETLLDLCELYTLHGGAALGPLAASRLLRKKTVQLKPVDQLSGWTGPGAQPQGDVWLRAVRFEPEDDLLQYAGLAYLSDNWVNTPARVMHARTLFDGELSSLSLNHNLWFHRPIELADWLLYLLDSPSTYGGTGTNRGLIYDRSGRLVASAAQEALVRRLSPPA